MKDNLELAGRVLASEGSYSKYYNEHYESNGVPKGFDLEKIFNNPQDNIDTIFSLCKYYYNKYGIIMRVINIIRDFGTTGYDLEYPTQNEKVEKVIKDYNKRIKINQLLKDMIFELALTGNCAGYDRNGKRVDIYSIPQIEVTNIIKDNKPFLMYKNEISSQFEDGSLPQELKSKLLLTYPKEVAKGIRAGKDKIVLDIENTFFLKTNSSRYEAYGVPFILTAFDELAHKTVLKEAERSTATGIIEKILRIAVGDKDHKPKQPEIDFYNALFDGKKGSLKVTVPYFVNLEWIEPETSIFGREKFEQVDLDILNALGVSLTLIRGEGGGNYSEGFISVTGLIKTIDSLRTDIPDVIHELYRKELKRNGINEDEAPIIKFNPVEIDKTAKLEMLQWLFSNASLPYEVLYKEAGYDYMSVKLKKEKENKENLDETFKLHSQPFQGNMGAEGTDPNNEGGAPKKNNTERKTDKGQSNNSQPRPSTSK